MKKYNENKKADRGIIRKIRPELVLYFVNSVSFIFVFYMLSVQNNMLSIQNRNIDEFTRKNELLLENIRRLELFDKKHALKNRVEGVYWPSLDSYCVYLDSKDFRQVYKTDLHEYYHALLDDGTCYNGTNNISCRDHFCEDH